MNDSIRYFKVTEISRDEFIDEFVNTSEEDINDTGRRMYMYCNGNMYVAIDTTSTDEFTVDINEIGYEE